MEVDITAEEWVNNFTEGIDFVRKIVATKILSPPGERLSKTLTYNGSGVQNKPDGFSKHANKLNFHFLASDRNCSAVTGRRGWKI